MIFEVVGNPAILNRLWKRLVNGTLSVLQSVPLFVLLAIVLTAQPLRAYETPRNLKPGLDGALQLGALASFGQTDSSAVSARTTLTWSQAAWEHELDLKFYRSSSEALVQRFTADGEVILDTQGREVLDRVRSTTNHRRFVSAQLRRFISSKYYVFGIYDHETNKPAGVDYSTRQVGGLGYKLWHSKHDLIGAALGFGHKRRSNTSGMEEKGAIAYLGLRFKRKLSKKYRIKLDLDSDFGSDNRYTEMEVSLGVKLREPVSLGLKYEVRSNSTVIDPLNRFDNGLESALSINLAIDVF